MPKGNNYKGGQNNRRGGGNNSTQSQSLSALIASNKPSFLNPAGTPAAGAAAASLTAAGLTHTVTLSDPEFRTLVALHEKEEQERKNKEMQAMLDAYVAKAGGTVPAAAQAAPPPVKQPAVTAPPQNAAEKEEEGGEDDEKPSKSKKARDRLIAKIKDEEKAEAKDFEIRYLKSELERKELAERLSLLEKRGGNDRGYRSDDESEGVKRRTRSSSKKANGADVPDTPDRKEDLKKLEQCEGELAVIKKRIADRKIKPSPVKSTTSQDTAKSKSTARQKAQFRDLLGEFGLKPEDLQKLAAEKSGANIKKEGEGLDDKQSSDSDSGDFLTSDVGSKGTAKSDTKKATRAKKKLKVLPLTGPLLVLKEVLDKCKIPGRPVKLGDAFIAEYDEKANILTERLLKVSALRVQLEGLLKDTFNYSIGSRETKTLVLEMMWIAVKSGVKIPKTVMK